MNEPVQVYFQENKPDRDQVHRLRISPLICNASDVHGILALPKRLSMKELLNIEILKSGEFCNLVELSVRFEGNEWSELKCSTLIQHLSNAPKLKKLGLNHGKMSLSHLHQLHCNAQQLEVLDLVDLTLASTMEGQEQLILSSITLTELYLFECTEKYKESTLNYMEYTNLKILQVHVSPTHNEKYGEQQLIRFVSHCQYLETYSVSIHPITLENMEAIYANERACDNAIV
ncbi:hypothetical protein [Parasitella parasitica]|uniref:F-box domain-containing protein n=1 Tax=Parasitella parasitica TaxID=35722 RepID=A0A0B7NE05_9FUNG|nr:hypothetical protein [Parasitella parasitica]